MTRTSIEWTQKTWNPVRGCSRVSKGCEHCYAERQAARFAGEGGRFEGLVKLSKKHGPQWTGRIEFVSHKLEEPLTWREPTLVFVNSMSDLFHEGLRNEEIAAVFGVMAASPKHTFQVLTKRPERARDFFRWLDKESSKRGMLTPMHHDERCVDLCTLIAQNELMRVDGKLLDFSSAPRTWWPNVWLGVSVEDQATANERIPVLLSCPAAIRFVSYEPALGPVDFECVELGNDAVLNALTGHVTPHGHAPEFTLEHIDWVIVGGESGPGARPFDLQWALSTVEDCRDARVACFVKQLGSEPYSSHDGLADQCTNLRGIERVRFFLDRKGRDPSEWPEDLRVREWPEARS